MVRITLDSRVSRSYMKPRGRPAATLHLRRCSGRFPKRATGRYPQQQGDALNEEKGQKGREGSEKREVAAVPVLDGEGRRDTGGALFFA
jgi:hypothetical protein